MAERVLNDPLSGHEIVKDVAEQVSASLKKDCFLTGEKAYQEYGAKIEISIWAVDCGRRETITQTIQAGARKDAPEGSEADSISIQVDPAPPNEVRVRSDQGVPVATKDENGRDVVKRVHYSRRQLKTAK